MVVTLTIDMRPCATGLVQSPEEAYLAIGFGHYLEL